MPAIDVADLKAHLNLTTDTDDALLTKKIAAAEAWIVKYTGEEMPEVVEDDLKEAVRQLAAHLYENREATLIGITASELPFGLLDLLAPYRAWSFGCG